LGQAAILVDNGKGAQGIEVEVGPRRHILFPV
jgi:hypothetical protein